MNDLKIHICIIVSENCVDLKAKPFMHTLVSEALWTRGSIPELQNCFVTDVMLDVTSVSGCGHTLRLKCISTDLET